MMPADFEVPSLDAVRAAQKQLGVVRRRVLSVMKAVYCWWLTASEFLRALLSYSSIFSW